MPNQDSEQRTYARLLEPVALGPVTIKNRVVMLPHTTFFTQQERLTSKNHHYYVERARSHVGLIVTETQTVHPSGAQWSAVDASNVEALRAWTRTIDDVHDAGAWMFAQLSHFGVDANTLQTMRAILAPSAVASPVSREVPRAMTREDMAEARTAFAESAARCLDVGFDGIEVKVGHDGLLRTFLSPFFNLRDDEYGGSTLNRCRFIREVFAAVRESIGSQSPLGIRFCLDEGFPGGYSTPEAMEYATLLAEDGAIDYFSVDFGTMQSVDLALPPMAISEGFATEAIAALRDVVDVPVIAAERIKSPAYAERLIADGVADLVGLARQLLADPQWLEKATSGREAEIRPCVACNQECCARAVASLPIACVHNPAAGREEWLGIHTLRRADPRAVLVIGGGPAGLKAAEVAAMRGHRVSLLERDDHLGGQVHLAALAPGRAEWGEITRHLEARVEQLGVDVMLGTELTVDELLRSEADAIIVATGSKPASAPFAVSPGSRVLDEWQIMRSSDLVVSRCVVVDLGGRYQAAAVVETMLSRGAEVVWVSTDMFIGARVDPTTFVRLKRRLADRTITEMAQTAVVAVDEGSVSTVDLFSGAMSQIADVDCVVVVGNKQVDDALARGLEGAGRTVHVVGDCLAPRHVTSAIYEGELAGRAI